MGYNPYFPAYQPYNGYYPQIVQQPQMVQQPQNPQLQSQATQPVTAQIQNGGFITVHSESEARNYPVAPGTSVTFKHETAPYCYTKTMGFSQFEAPKFEKFRLIKEEDVQFASEESKDTPKPEYASKNDLGIVAGAVKEMNGIIDSLRQDVDSLKNDMYGLSGKRKVSKKPDADLEE